MAKYLDNPDGYFRARREEEQDAPVTLTATEARQGSWGKPVLYVLVCGLILAMIAWWGAEYRYTDYKRQNFDLDSGSDRRGLKTHELNLGLGVRF